MQRELSCVCVRCGAACEQGLRTQHSMRMHFLLSAPSLLENCGLGGKNKTQSFQKLFSEDIFLYLLNIFATSFPKLKQKISKIIFKKSNNPVPKLKQKYQKMQPQNPNKKYQKL